MVVDLTKLPMPHEVSCPDCPWRDRSGYRDIALRLLLHHRLEVHHDRAPRIFTEEPSHA